MSNYLVTGCAGFIGSNLSKTLLERGDSVLGVDSLSNYYSREFKLANLDDIRAVGGRFIFQEQNVENLTASAVENIDGIFHLAAQPGVRASWGIDFQNYLTDNVLATQRLFELVKGAIPTVYASSSSVYGNSLVYPVEETQVPTPISPYGVTKASCDLLAEAYRINYGGSIAGLRYFTVYGPKQRPDMAFTKICASITSGRPFEIYGDGEQTRDFTFVSDAVSATIQILESHESGVFNIGGGSEISLKGAIQAFENISGKRVNLVLRERMSGDVQRTGASTSKLRSQLDWTAQVDFLSGIALHWVWAESNASMVERAVYVL